MRQANRAGFTLVEILIVVVIMGILAAIVVPQFSQSSDDARYSSTLQNLQSVRGQIDLFRNQHANLYPGGAADVADDTKFFEQLTLPSNELGVKGNFADPAFPFGPYIHNQLPANPFNGSRTVQNVGSFPVTAPGGTTVGWVFERTSGRFKINQPGNIPGSTTVTYWSL